MTTINENQLIKSQEWRYAVKKFDATKKIPNDTWMALEKSLVLTPSSYGLQPWKFLVVENAEIRKKLRAISWNQSQVEEASHYVVFCYKKTISEKDVDSFIQLNAETRNTPVEKLSGYRNMMIGNIVNGGQKQSIPVWTSRQVYIALGNFMTSAALLGIDTCPLEGFDPSQYDEVLGLTNSEYSTVCACAAGYRSQDDNYASLKKVRFPHKQVVEHI